MKYIIYLVLFFFIANIRQITIIDSHLSVEGFACFAQKEAYNWYFGSHCGISFNTPLNTPKFLTDGQMTADEGCATISDFNGNLLFYTDGVSVWSRQHVIMPNGFNLKGHTSSTQSAVIIPKPRSTSLFYIFTVDQQAGPQGLRYSVVDMKLNSGYGNITTKNILLHYPVCEKITAVKHHNGIDVWVITHEWNSNNFLAYLVTDTGIVVDPVVSSSRTVHTGDVLNAGGYMKASPDGKYIADAVYFSGLFELCNFDNRSGLVNKPITFNLKDSLRSYGIEFSPDASKMYVSRVNKDSSVIFQIDLKAGDSAAIVKSLYRVVSSPDSWVYHAMQFASDKKIYIAKRNSTFLSTIENPNEKGVNCGFVENSFNLQGRKSNAGLPTFNQSFIDIYLAIQGNNSVCEGDTITLYTDYYDGASYTWTGPNGFQADTNFIKIPQSSVSFSGYYKVTLHYKNIIKADSFMVTVMPKPEAVIQEGNTAYLCEGESLTLHATGNSNTNKFIWHDGSTTQTFTISQPGKYKLIAESKSGCQDSTFIDIILTEKPQPVILSKNGFKLCLDGSLSLFTDKKYKSCLWSDGQSTDTITVTSPGKYTLTVWDDKGCSAITEITVDRVSLNTTILSDIDFGNDLIQIDKQIQLEFYNLGTDTISIISIHLGRTSNEFSLELNPTPVVRLKTGEKIEITIHFKPDSAAFYSDSLFIVIDEPCSRIISVGISGTGSGLVSTIRIPDMKGLVGDTNFSIPIIAKLENTKFTYNLSFDCVISFDMNVFLPDLNQPGIVSDDIKDGKRILKISEKNIQLTGTDSTIYSIKGMVLMFDKKVPVNFDNFEWDNKNLTIDTINGSLEPYGTCQPGLSRIQFFNDLSFDISPNPSGGNLTLKSTFDLGQLRSINFYDIEGRQVHSISLSDFHSLEHKYELKIEFSDITSGFYILQMKTDGEIFTKYIHVIK